MKELNRKTVSTSPLPIKILQFGEGNFLRAFVDWMIDKANKKGVMNHGVLVVQPIEKGMADLLKKQDCLYHVYLEGIKDKHPIKEVSLVESIQNAINPYVEYDVYEKCILSPELEIIISNTTEAGIRYEEGDDLNAKPPKSFPAKITALLHHRYKHFNGAADKGLVFICCELIENNGSTLREFVIKHAQANNLGEDFINWIKTSCHFYDTLVDRIVPGFPKENIDEIKQEIGLDDNLVVKGEYFHVWAIGGDPVIKEKFPLDKAGLNVLFMDCIKAFRDKKVRILNGAHTAMVPVALQMGCTTVMEAFNNPLVEKFINTMVAEEVLPAIDEDPEELKKFSAKILERFYNPYIKHYLETISLNSLSKWETRDYPTLLDNYTKHGKFAKRTAFSLAALIVLYSGKSNINFTPNDTPEHIQFIRDNFNANDVNASVKAILSNKQIWTVDLLAVPQLVEEVSKFISSILSCGMEESLKVFS